MDTTLITIIIAIIVAIPGIWALVDTQKKDKEAQQSHISHYTSLLSDELWKVKKEMYGLATETKWKIDDLSNITVDGLWKKMYEKPVIVICQHCKSPNLITNINCTQCGAPAGNFKEIKNESR